MGTPTLDIDGPRATISLQRPDKRNRIEPDDLVHLLEHCETIDAASGGPDGVRVVVLRSEGPVFCAGYHLGALAEGARPEVGFGDLCDRLAAVRVPVVARIGGDIHGGGTDLAIACDLRVAVAGVRLQMPAARLGIQYYATGLERFVHQLGPAATKRIFLTALPVAADRLVTMGYLHDVVEADELDAAVDRMVEAVAGLAPVAVASTKAAIDGLASGTLSVDEVEATARASLRTEDHAEALRALAERRPARFQGR